MVFFTTPAMEKGSLYYSSNGERFSLLLQQWKKGSLYFSSNGRKVFFAFPAIEKGFLYFSTASNLKGKVNSRSTT